MTKLIVIIALIISALIGLREVSHEISNRPGSVSAAQEIRQLAQRIRVREERARAERLLRARIEREQSSLLAILSSRNGGVVSDRDWILLTRIYRLFGKDAKLAVAVARAESGFRCDAVNYNTNGTTDHSLFQLNSVHAWRGEIDDCEKNVEIAYQIYKDSYFYPWVAYTRRLYSFAL